MDILIAAQNLGLDLFKLYGTAVETWRGQMDQCFRARGLELHPDKHDPSKRQEMTARFQAMLRDKSKIEETLKAWEPVRRTFNDRKPTCFCSACVQYYKVSMTCSLCLALMKSKKSGVFGVLHIAYVKVPCRLSGSFRKPCQLVLVVACIVSVL